MLCAVWGGSCSWLQMACHLHECIEVAAVQPGQLLSDPNPVHHTTPGDCYVGRNSRTGRERVAGPGRYLDIS